MPKFYSYSQISYLMFSMEIKWTFLSSILLIFIVSNVIVEGQSTMTFFNPTVQINSLINDDVIP